MIKIAIIGTRQPSPEQTFLAQALAETLAKDKHHVLTGAAYGIDHAAMRGALEGTLEVFLPWASYNRDIIPAHALITVYDPKVHLAWTESVATYHPAPRALTRGAFALHARNFGIVETAHAVVAFPETKGKGGTAQGVRIAEGLNIPVFEFDQHRPLPSLDELAEGLAVTLF